MIFSPSDFPHIKWSMLAFLLALSMGGIIIAASENIVARSMRDQRSAERQLNEARGRLATAKEDHENMRAYALEYNALLQRNVIGNDRRLDWVEGLEKIHKRDRAPGFIRFKYAIAPQKSYAPSLLLDSGIFDMNLSGMTLRFELLHEEQLTAFFDALHSDIKGWFIIERCDLERVAATADTDGAGVAHRLKAECTGGWLTLKNRNEK